MNSSNAATYKDYQNQYLVEAKLKPKNVREISKEEALVKYKRNAYVLGRIFNAEGDDIATGEDAGDKPYEAAITEDVIDKLKEDLQESVKRQNQKLSEYVSLNKKFASYFNEFSNVKDDESLKTVIEKLKADNLYMHEHPFLNEFSPFYLSNEDSIIKPVNPEIDGKNPSWDPNDNVQLISL